jgi:hypothetical protein
MPWNDRTKRRLKLRDLDILVAVIETGTMGEAATRLEARLARRYLRHALLTNPAAQNDLEPHSAGRNFLI